MSKLPKAALLLPVATVAVASLPSPAAAHDVNLYWGDNEDLLSQSGVNTGDVVGAWQHLLYTDGLLAGSGVDGLFGPVTASATSAWDTDFGVSPADSEVENGASQTWAKAGLALDYFGEDSSFTYMERYNPGPRGSTLFAMSKSSYNWKWRGGCAENKWLSMNHSAINFTNSC